MTARFSKSVEEMSTEEIANLLAHLATELATRRQTNTSLGDAHERVRQAVAIVDQAAEVALKKVQAWQAGLRPADQK